MIRLVLLTLFAVLFALPQTALAQAGGRGTPARLRCDTFYENLKRRVRPAPSRASRARRPSNGPATFALGPDSYAELSEGNAAQWAAFASDNAQSTLADSAAMVKVGARSIQFTTASGFESGVRFPATGDAHWDLTSKTHLSFWAYGSNTNQYGFQGNQPVVTLRCAGGTLRYVPATQLMSNGSWGFYSVPLAGSRQWRRTSTGVPVLSDVLQLELAHDTWGYSYTVFYDGVTFAGPSDNASWPTPAPPPGVSADAIAPRVLLYCFDPIMENKGGVRLHDAYPEFRDPVGLTSEIVSTMSADSHGVARYQVVDTVVADAHPYFADGFQHTDASFDSAWRARQFHNATFDYARFVRENNIAARIESGDIDEVWIYAGPINGMYESAMAGAGAYWINGIAPGIACKRAFVMMGWNFERRVGEAIHSFGHRAESIMAHSYGAWEPDQATAWNTFTLQDRQAVGLGGVGNVHFPVNGTADYDYANGRTVTSSADRWAVYPSPSQATRAFSCSEWTPLRTDPQREYLSWWYARMPHVGGMAPDGFLANWWRYLLDVDQFKGWDGNVAGTQNAPRVMFDAPLAGATVSGVVNVAVDAAVEGALGRVDFYVDGAYRATDTLAPFTFKWDTAGLEGSHRLEARAYELRFGREAVAAITVNASNKIQFSAQAYRISEGAASASITVTRASASEPATVRYATGDGTALAGSDYTAASGVLSFAAGEASKSFAVPIRPDLSDEDDETVALSLSEATGGALGSPASATLTIADDDEAPTASVQSVTVAEGAPDQAPPAPAVFSVELSAPSAKAITVSYATSAGTATEKSDYEPVAGTVSFAPGQTRASVAVPITGDDRHEADETFTLALSAPSNATLSAEARTATGTITDDDPLGFAIAPASGLATSEAGGASTFTVRLTSQPASDVTLPLASSNAGEGVPSASTCVFTSANWNVAQTVTVTGVDDAIVDGAQSYAIVTAPAQSTDPDYNGRDALDVGVTNADNDSATLALSLSSTSIVENAGASAATVTLRRNFGLDAAAAATLSSSSREITVPASVAFAAGSATATFAIGVADNAVADGPRSATISATLGAASATAPLAIADNEVASLTLTLSPTTIAENSRTAISATLSRNTSTASALAVALSSSDTTEASVPASVTIPAGASSVTFAVRAVDDKLADGTQRVAITARALGLAEGIAFLLVTDNEKSSRSLARNTEATAPSRSLAMALSRGVAIWGRLR